MKKNIKAECFTKCLILTKFQVFKWYFYIKSFILSTLTSFPPIKKKDGNFGMKQIFLNILNIQNNLVAPF